MRRREGESRNSHLRNMIAMLYLNMGQLTWREKEEGGEAYLIGLPHRLKCQADVTLMRTQKAHRDRRA